MAAFSYSAINASGAELSGEISAADLPAAREALRVKGLLAQTLKEIDSGGGVGQITIGGGKKVKPKSLQIFSRQFATMIEAGLNVVSALVILEDQTEDQYLGAVIKELRADVEGGLLLSQALGRHPRIPAASPLPSIPNRALQLFAVPDWAGALKAMPDDHTQSLWLLDANG